MINLSSELSGIYPETVALMNIFCLKAAFDGSALAADIWTQNTDGRTASVIARNGGRLYIHCEGSDLDEVKSFIKVIGYEEIFCSTDTAQKLGLAVLKEFSVLSVIGCKKKEPPPFNISLKALYDRLCLGTDGEIDLPDFETFAPDISHRLRHGGAAAFLSENGAAIVFLNDFGGIINGISVSVGKRGKGEGSELLSRITEAVDGDIFVCCDEKIKEFYKSNGFTECGKAVIAR